MSPHEALIAHLDRRPILPNPVPEVGTKAWNDWRRDMRAWMEEKAILEMERDGVVRMEFTRQTPVVTPRADYIYREPVKRKRKRPNRPAWSGADREYNRIKKQEQRAREKAERAALIREGLNERKAG